MLLLSAEDPTRDIWLYINSPGGSVTAGMAIYDTMNFIQNDVPTVVMGLAASMGQFLLCAGTKGKRYALPHARVMMHQPSVGIGGTASDIAIQAEQILYTKRTMIERIAFHTGQTVEQIDDDSDRDRWFTAEEAKDVRLRRPRRLRRPADPERRRHLERVMTATSGVPDDRPVSPARPTRSRTSSRAPAAASGS